MGHAAAEGVQDERAYTLLLIGYKAETSIADATRALVERPSLAQRVIDEDDEVDRLELEIDDICFEILAREQPVASDLRFMEPRRVAGA